MAEEFYLVKIGTINLTVDGLVTGAPCLNKVSGLAKLFMFHVGNTAVPISGVPFNMIAENEGAGVELITAPFAIKTTVVADLKMLIDLANISGDPIPVEISDGPGSQNVDCSPLFTDGIPPLSFGENFFNDNMQDVQIRLITRGYTA
jgi:hypothetical protein